MDTKKEINSHAYFQQYARYYKGSSLRKTRLNSTKQCKNHLRWTRCNRDTYTCSNLRGTRSPKASYTSTYLQTTITHTII
jgi:hypothetical protein